MKTKWEDLFKVKIASPTKAMLKHEVVKTILVIKLMNKFRKDRAMIRAYTEFELENGLKPDVYFENLKTKEVMVFEIQKKWSDKWIEDRNKKYKDYEVMFFNTFDWIPIKLNDFPEDIEGIWEKLDEYI